MTSKSFACLFILFAGLFGCVTTCANELPAPKKLIIEGDISFPPYEFYNDQGEPDGFNIDIVKAVMAEMGRAYEIRLRNWADVVNDLEQKQVDMVTAMIYTNERAAHFKFGITHNLVNHVIINRKGERLKDIEELRDKQVIVQDHEYGYEILKKAGYADNIIIATSMEEALHLLADGAGDAALCDRKLARYVIDSQNLDQLEISNITLTPREYCFVGNDEMLLDEVSRAFSNIQENGTYERLQEKWFANQHTTSSIRLLSLFFAITLVGVLLLLFVNQWLRRKIHRAKELVRLETARYQTLFDNTDIGLEYYDNQGVMRDLNNAELEIFGIPDKALLINQVSLFDNPVVKDIINPNHPEPFSGILVYDLRKAHRDPYFAISTLDRILYVQTRINPIYGASGALESIIVTSIDMTQLELLHHKLEAVGEHLSLALEAGDVSVWTYDVAAQAFDSLTGHTQIKKGSSLEDNLLNVYPEDKHNIVDAMNRLLSEECKKTTCTYRIYNSLNDCRYIETQLISKLAGNRVVTITGARKDITEKVLREKLLEESIKKMHYAIKATSSVFFEFDTRTQLFKAYNERLNNYNDEQLLSFEDYARIMHPEDSHKIGELAQELLNGTSDQVSIDIRQRYAEGEPWEYCTITIAPFERDAQGHIVRFVGFRSDNTKLITYQKKLEEYKLKMDLAIKSSRVIVWEYDVLKQQLAADHAAIANQSVETTIEGFLSVVHPDERDKAREVVEAVQRGEPRVFRLDIRLRHSDETDWSYITQTCVPLLYDKTGRCTKYVGYRLDTTRWHELSKDLEKSNQMLHSIINNLPCALFIKDADHDYRYLIVNEFTTDVLNMTRETMIGKTSGELYGESKGEEILKRDLEATETGYCTFRDDTLPCQGRVFQTSKYLLKTIDGKRLLICISLDITSMDNTLNELQREKEKAQQADKLKSAFLANMSHEIRTPLNAIVGFSALLQTAEDVDERREYMQIINSNNDLLLRLIGDILDLSKIESGAINLNYEEFDLSSTFRETYLALQQRCTNPAVEFVGINPYASCIVTLDKNRMVQVGTNFLTNALKYTAAGHVIMGYEYIDHGIKVYVSDTGIGISEEKQKRVFQRFEKLDSFAQGTGLGLAISKAITEVMGGKIGFTSKVGEGSTFWAWFPCEAKIVPGETIESGVGRCNNEPNLLKVAALPEHTLSILVAEDSDSNFLLLKAILRGHRLTRACNGQEAVEHAAEESFDVILMDLKMPIMDGLEATRQIRQRDTHTPIFAVTANAFDSDREAAQAAGCTGFIAKPIQQGEIEEVLRTI